MKVVVQQDFVDAFGELAAAWLEWARKDERVSKGVVGPERDVALLVQSTEVRRGWMKMLSDALDR